MTAPGLRLAFMGSPEFAVPALRALHAAGHEILAVYSQAPRPAGRGQALRRAPVHEAADALGLAVRTPARLRQNPAEHAYFQALGLDAAVVAAYGLLLPPEMLAAPRRGCLNLHASLLPRWRGAAPIQAAIRAGDAQTGMSIMQMDPGLDTGPVLLREALPISAQATTPDLLPQLAELGARLILRALETAPAATPQDPALATYAPKLSRADARLDWRQDAAAIARQIRAFLPWPGTETQCNGLTLKLLAAEILPGIGTPGIGSLGIGTPGTVLDDRLTIACGTGALRPTRLQTPGKPAMATADFLRGRAIPPGTVLD